MRYTLAGAFQLIIVPVSGVRSQFLKRSFAARRGALAASTAFAALMSLSSESFAGPSGGSVVQGNANIATAGSVTNINQSSDKAIINWQSFSVGKGETVNFNQPSTTSVTLNRVTGNESSVIAGALNANGRVVLVNSNGILFSQGSQVNVGGLVASTLDISDANFMAGNYHFEGTSAASVVNQGHIRASAGGYVALLGKTVSNDGVISATLGTVAMASGNKITLNFDGNSLIDVTIDEGTLNALIQNKGAIKADGGRVILTAKAADSILSAQVNNSGIIQARTMSALKGGGSNSVRIGTIKLTANGGSVSSSGKLIASAKKGGNGGTVSLAATGGSVTVAGEVDVSSVSGTGGTVTVTGQDVVLTSTASINADGATGGIILVGGDRHGGSDPTENLIAETLANATTTTIAAGATLSANGTNGNGGAIIVWSNDYTNYAGSISATGAGQGNGGFAEVSSEGVLGFTGTANLLSVNGITGTLLLDPFDVVISNGTDTGTASLTGADPTAASVINIANLVVALATANVTITTGASVTDPNTGLVTGGSITIANALSWTTPYTLTLIAATDVNINAAVSWGTGGGLTATATGGNVNVNAPITWSSGTLSLNAGQNVYVNDVLTASSSGNFSETNPTSGTNRGGLPYGLYFSTGQSGYTGQLNISGTGSVTLNGQSYTVINSAADLATAEASPTGNYVLGSNIANLNYSDLATFGFGSSSTFTGNFNGFGHSLTIAPTTNFTIGSAVSIPSTVASTNFVLTSSSDLYVNAPVSWATGVLTLQAADNIYVNAVMSAAATSVASFAATYGTGMNADSYTPMGLYTAQGTAGTFTGRVDILGYGTVWLNNEQYTVVNNVSTLPVQSTGNYVLGVDYSTSGFSSTTFSGNFNGLGHVITMTAPTSGGANSGGLFNTIDSNATISNIGISTSNIVKLYIGPTVANTGVLANVNEGTVINSFTTGYVASANWSYEYSGENVYFGGLIGVNSGKILNSYSSVTLSGGLEEAGVMFVGGLVGVNQASGIINDSYSTGNLITFYGYTGGLVGVNSGTIDSSYSSASFTILKADNGGTSVVSSVGGLVGWNTSTGEITNSYAVTTTTGIGVLNSITTAARLASKNDSLSTIAGFVYQNDGIITNAYSAGTLGVSTSQWTLAGFVYNNTGTISDVYSAVTLLSSNNATYVSSFYNTNSGSITNAYWDASLVGAATQTGSLVTGLSAAAAKDIANYAGFDPTYWGSSTDGHPILRTIPIYVVPVANSSIEYGSDGAAIKSDLTVRGLQWGDTVSSLTFDPQAGLESVTGHVNAGTYLFSQLFSSSVYTNVTGSIKISPKVLTLDAAGIVVDKVYDGTIAAIIHVIAANGGLDGLVVGETLGVSYSNAYFIDKNAGTDKTVYVSLVLSDGTGLASNYVVNVKTTTADITAKQITGAYTASDKTYDGTTTAVVTASGSLSGVVSGDQVSISTTGQFASASAGTHIAVSASLTGDDAANYTFASSAVYASIQPRPIELSGAKIADGSTSVAANQLQAINLVPGDSVTLSGSVSLTSASSGVQSIQSFSGLGSLGNSNYTLVGATGSVAILSSYLPVLSSIASGTVTTSSTPTSLTVNQTTASAIINWTSFNIAPGYSVIFNQPSATSVTLNRIIGNETSIIAGSLTANGQLIFVNSAGILFAAGSTVNVGGIIASTQDISDADFTNGIYNFGSNAATGSITALGTITVDEGSYAAFLGNGVTARGSITARGGTILLAGGEGISLNLNTSTKKLSGFSVTTADKTVTAGGILDVSSTSGSGGIIATQGSSISILDTLQANATGTTANGYWLIQTNGDLTIGSGGVTTGTALTRLLGQVSVTANSSAIAAVGNVAAVAGDININDAVSWSANTLTLNAAGSIYVNNVMTASGTANFTGTTGNGTNADGSSQGLYTAFGTTDGTYAGKIDFSSSGTVTLNNHVYTAIRTLDQLAAINGTSGYYFLANNLTDYLPYTSAVVASFNGVLDGFGHVINNLTINDQSQNGFDALIGTLGADRAGTAAVRNIGLVNASITGQGSFVAGLVASFPSGTIGNSFVTGTLVGPNMMGGLVAYQGYYVNAVSPPIAATIENSYADITIINGYGLVNGIGTAGGAVGGLVGTATANSLIINSHAKGSITSTFGGDVGGFIGNNAGTIGHSWADVTVTSNGGGNGSIGGFAGYNEGLIYNGSYSLGNVTGTDVYSAGGFVGWNTGFIIGTVDGVDHGADYYALHPEDIAIIYSTGNLTVTINATTSSTWENYGGFAGYNFGRVVGSVYLGGVLDYISSSGNVSITITYPDAGVIVSNVGDSVGQNSIGSVTNNTSTGTVSCNAGAGHSCLNVDPCTNGRSCVVVPPPPPCTTCNQPPPPPPPDPTPVVSSPPPDTSTTTSVTPPTDPGTNVGTGTGVGTGIGTGTGTGTGGASLGGQAARAGGSAIAGTAGGGGSSSSSPDSNNPAGAQQQSASLNPNSLDDQISSQVPATTTPPPPAKPKEKKERKALNTPKQKPDAGYGAEIRSIVIDGQKYDLQDEGPKNGDTPKTDAPKTDAPAGDAPNKAAPSALAPAGDKPQ